MKRLIVAAGGTGGHIFPALAIAQAFRQAVPGGEVLFVGAEGGMEANLAASHGLPLQLVWIGGFYRQFTWQNIKRNLMLPVKYIWSGVQARRIIRSFKPDAVVGCGGYASFPVLNAAVGKPGIVTALQEQNAFPGLVNRKLASKVQLVFLGNTGASEFFPKEKSIFTGNPLRAGLAAIAQDDALARFGLDPGKPTLVVMGGSLGARAINTAVLAALPALTKAGIQVLWQCGKQYHEALAPQVSSFGAQVRLLPFVDDMAAAYSAASLVVCRAGALTVSELMALQVPSLLIPSPNVADDHQTHNARSAALTGGAQLLAEDRLVSDFEETVLSLLADAPRLAAMRQALAALPPNRAAQDIIQKLLNTAPAK